MSSPYFILRHPLLGSPPDPFSLYIGRDLNDEPDDLSLDETPIEKTIVVSINQKTQSVKMNTVSPQFSRLDINEFQTPKKSCCEILFSIFCCCIRPKKTTVTTEIDLSSTKLTIRVDGSYKPSIIIPTAEQIICELDPEFKEPEFNTTSQADLARGSVEQNRSIPADIRDEIIGWRQNMIKDIRLPSPQAVNWILTIGLNTQECRIIKALLLKKENEHYVPFLTKKSKHVLHFVSAPKGSPIFDSLRKGSSRPSSPAFTLSF